MQAVTISIKAKVWLYKGDSPWHFITIDKTNSEEVRRNYIWPRKGFGSIPVMVKIGKTKWKTSIFPDKEGVYLLPLKKEVRNNENIKVGDNIGISLTVIN